MIPWLITVTTKRTPEEVMNGLLKYTDESASIYSPAFKIGFQDGIEKELGGKLYMKSRKFRLVRRPYDLVIHFTYRTVMEGSVRQIEGRSNLRVLLRPSIGAVLFFLVIVFFERIAIKRVIWGVGSIAEYLIFLIGMGYCLLVVQTWRREIRAVKELLARIFPD